MADIFALQDEISAAIAAALKVKLAPAPERRMPNVPAYEATSIPLVPVAVHTGGHAAQPRVSGAGDRARSGVRAALCRPGRLLPRALVGWRDPSHEAMPRARELARARSNRSDLPEAHAMLGIVAGHYDFDWAEAARCFNAARRDQMSPHLRQWHAQFYLLSIGRASDGLAEHRQVLDEDPLCQTWHYTAGTTLNALGRDEEAVAEMRKSVEIDPEFWLGWLWLGAFQAVRRQHDEALSCAGKAIARAPWSPYVIGLMAAALTNVQRSDEAAPYLARLRDDLYGGPAGLMCTPWLAATSRKRSTGQARPRISATRSSS